MTRIMYMCYRILIAFLVCHSSCRTTLEVDIKIYNIDVEWEACMYLKNIHCISLNSYTYKGQVYLPVIGIISSCSTSHFMHIRLSNKDNATITQP